MTTREPLPQLLTIDDVAEQLGTTPRHIRRLVAERRIPFLKVGRFIRFDPDDITMWLDASRRDVEPPRTVPGGRDRQVLQSAQTIRARASHPATIPLPRGGDPGSAR